LFKWDEIVIYGRQSDKGKFEFSLELFRDLLFGIKLGDITYKFSDEVHANENNKPWARYFFSRWAFTNRKQYLHKDINLRLKSILHFDCICFLEINNTRHLL
jgi:hypothetical protein